MAEDRVPRAGGVPQGGCACSLAALRSLVSSIDVSLRLQAGPKRIVELGCGNGSTLFPLLAANENPKLDLHGYDYSKEAVSVVKVRFPPSSPLPY